MAHSLLVADKSVELSSLKNSDAEQTSAPATKGRFWQRMSAVFWAYTEESGKADTSSYEGLL